MVLTPNTATGLFDPFSPIRVRVLHHNEKVSVGPGLVLDRVRAAAMARERDGVLPDDTDGYRVVNVPPHSPTPRRRPNPPRGPDVPAT